MSDSGKYRKKPVIVDALEWTGKPMPLPDWLRNAIPGLAMIVSYGDDPTCFLKIATREGEMQAGPGDWIIRGIKGELYPCKPDIFIATYERIDA